MTKKLSHSSVSRRQKIQQKVQERSQVLLTMVLVLFAFGSGYAIAQDVTNGRYDGHTHDTPHVTKDAHEGTHHDKKTDAHSKQPMHAHAQTNVPAGTAPTVQLDVKEDAAGGWNVAVNTTNFAFAPENVNGAHVEGQGHAHLYVDGKKVARLYGPNFHYDGKFDGTKTFRVTLNTNDHNEYAVDNKAIEATQQVTHAVHN